MCGASAPPPPPPPPPAQVPVIQQLPVAGPAGSFTRSAVAGDELNRNPGTLGASGRAAVTGAPAAKTLLGT